MSKTEKLARPAGFEPTTPWFVAKLSAEELIADYAQLAKLIIPADISPTVAGDPDDDQFLACALVAEADAVVSGDKRLRSLKSYHRIPILSTFEALASVPRDAEGP